MSHESVHMKVLSFFSDFSVKSEINLHCPLNIFWKQQKKQLVKFSDEPLKSKNLNIIIKSNIIQSKNNFQNFVATRRLSWQGRIDNF